MPTWIQFTHCGASPVNDIYISVKADQIAGFRPLKFGEAACSVIYFNGMHLVVRESYEEIRTLLGLKSENIGPLRSAS